MEVFKSVRSLVVLLPIAVNFMACPVSFANNTSKLDGKNLDQNRELVNAVMHGRNYVVEVDKLGQIKQVVDAGANGSGKDAQAIVNGKETEKLAPNVTSVELPTNY